MTRTIDLDDAPTTGTADTTGPSTAPPRTPAIAKLETQVRDFYTQFGTYAGMMAPDPFVGVCVATNAEPLASAWADLAAQDAGVRRTLEKVLAGGVWANLIGLHVAAIVAPTLAYYGRLPDQAAAMVLMATAQANPSVAPFIQARHAARQARNGGTPE